MKIVECVGTLNKRTRCYDVTIKSDDNSITCAVNISLHKVEKLHHAILYGLCIALTKYTTTKNDNQQTLLEPVFVSIRTKDVHVYNILKTYLPTWHKNGFIGNKTVIEHVAMLKKLYEKLLIIGCWEVNFVRS